MRRKKEDRKKYALFILYFLIIGIGALTGAASGYIYRTASSAALYEEPVLDADYEDAGEFDAYQRPGIDYERHRYRRSVPKTQRYSLEGRRPGAYQPTTLETIYGSLEDIKNAWKEYVETSVQLEEERMLREEQAR